ncbi:KN motif and ankyrin repeat domain-containing protein 4 isoform X2, partial [Silurus meridionalis]
YSVETPYGFHLDLDFVKYVEDIEKGNTIRRVQLQRRPRGRNRGNLSRNLSLPGYSCRTSQWSSTSILFPRTRLADSQQPCHPQGGDGETRGFRSQSEFRFKTLQAFDEQPLGPHVRPNLLRASSLPLTVLLRKYSTEDPTSPNGSKDFLSHENGSSEDVFHSPGGINGTFQQLSAALRRVGELEEEIRIIPELKAQICILQEERERLLHTFQSKPEDPGAMDFPGRVFKIMEKKTGVKEDWMDREYDQLEENIKASSQQVDTIETINVEKSSEASREEKSLGEALQKKVTKLQQKLRGLELDLEKTRKLLKEQEQESLLKDKRIDELTKQRAGNIWIRLDDVRSTQKNSGMSVETSSPESDRSKDYQVCLEEESKPGSEGGSQADMKQHVKKVRELLQEQWECIRRNEELGREMSSEHLYPRVCSIQTQLVSLVDLLTLYISQAGDPPPAPAPGKPPLHHTTDASHSEGIHVGGPSVSGGDMGKFSTRPWKRPVTSSYVTYLALRFVHDDEVVEGITWIEGPAGEELNQNISLRRTIELPSSTLSTRQQELIGETTAGTTHLTEPEQHHVELDRTCEEKRPEEQTAELDKQDRMCPEDDEGGRVVEMDFMKACHFLEQHMDEVSEPNDEMVIHKNIKMLFQQWFHVCAEENSCPEMVALYVNKVATENPAVLHFLVNMVDDNGNTALHYSVSHSNFSIVQLLLDTGVCDVDLKNKSGYTAVMLASLQPLDTEADMKVVEQLMEFGDVNARAGQVGQTPLHLAVRHGRASTVRLLLAHGANVNAQDQAGTTALISACDRGHADVVRILLQDPGCDVNLTDKGSRSALSLATQASHTEIADLLKARSTNTKVQD